MLVRSKDDTVLIEFNWFEDGHPVSIDPSLIYAVVDGKEVPEDTILGIKAIPRRTIIHYAYMHDRFEGRSNVAIVSDSYSDVMAALAQHGVTSVKCSPN